MTRLFSAFLLSAAVAAGQTASYPGAPATDNDLTVVHNNVTTHLTQLMGGGDTSMTVASSNGIVPNMLLNIDSEIVFVCGVSGVTVTIGKSSCPNSDGRGFDGTAAVPHSSGATTSNFIDAWNFNALTAEIKAMEATLSPTQSFINHGPNSWALHGPPNYVGAFFGAGGYSPGLTNGASGATALMGAIAGAPGATGGFVNGVNGSASTASAVEAVGLYAQAFPVAGATTGTNVFGINTWCSSLGIQIAGCIGMEIDTQSGANPPTNTVGIDAVSANTQASPGEFTAFLTDITGGGAVPWNFGLHLRPGTTAGGILIEASATSGTSLYSQPLNFRGASPGGGVAQVGMFATPWATLGLTKSISLPLQTTASATGTVTLDAAAYSMFELTLTGGTTIAVTGPAAASGTPFSVSICEDGGGGHTLTWPGNVKGGMAITTTASTCNNQTFAWDGTNALAMSAGTHY